MAEHWQAALFDLDGVVTDTASIHRRAWKQLFDHFLHQYYQTQGQPFQAFDNSDYLRFVDGKPRLDGIRSFMQSRRIRLAEGLPEDTSESNTVQGFGKRKNQTFLEILQHEAVPVFSSSVELIRDMRHQGIATAVVSSSRNCELILQATGLSELFDARVDGRDLDARKLSGKPAPDLFLAAASALKVLPKQTLVVEDAIAGVQAGRAGGFALVVGIARRQSGNELLKNGADIVVSDLAELTLERIDDWFRQLKPWASIGA